MPLPIAHALLGGAVCVASDRDGAATGYDTVALLGPLLGVTLWWRRQR